MTRLGYQRPLDSGLGIYSARTLDERTDDERLQQITNGTLTCLATRESDKKRVLLTCLHVMTGGIVNPLGGEEMYQGGHESTQKVGDSMDHIEFVNGDNRADAAVCELLDGVDASVMLPPPTADTSDTDSQSGSTSSDPEPVEPVKRMIVPGVTDPFVPVSDDEFMTLTLFGSRTGESTARVLEVNTTHRVGGRDFVNVVELDRDVPAIRGDSGSACLALVEVDEANNVEKYQMSCIFFAADDPRDGWALPAAEVRRELELEFGNRVPVADAGPSQAVESGDFVTLDPGQSVDDDGDPLTFTWEQTDDSGHDITLTSISNTSGRVTFTAPPGSSKLTFQVTVKDPYGGVDTATTNVHVTANPPQVNAGVDQSVNTRALVTMKAANTSTRRGITWQWEQLPGGPRVVLNHPDNRYTWFTAPGGACTLKFRATGTDRQGVEDCDDLTVEVENQAPTVRGLGDQTVGRRAGVALSVAVSDPDVDDMDRLKMLWTQESGPAVELTDANTDYATFEAPNSAATLEFLFTVVDPRKFSATYTETVTVE